MTRDETESEVATMKYIAGVPVPERDSGTNAIGAGYILMEKVPGRSAHSMWPKLPHSDKRKIVTQVARYLIAAFQVRFDQVQLSLVNSRMGFWCILTNAWLRALRNVEAHSAIQRTGYHVLCEPIFSLSNHITSPHRPFSFRFADISLKNIMVDETCQITGFINFE